MPYLAAAVPYIVSGVASAAVGAGINYALRPKTPSFAIPPPPGASLINPAGQASNAASRQRQAAAGGLGSTVTGAGQAAAASTATGATAGGKSLLGS